LRRRWTHIYGPPGTSERAWKLIMGFPSYCIQETSHMTKILGCDLL
jgi:hypothetical protein